MAVVWSAHQQNRLQNKRNVVINAVSSMNQTKNKLTR